MKNPSRPYKWGEPVGKDEDVRAQCACHEMREALELDALQEPNFCPECKREASEPCPCFEETEEREQ